MKKMLKDIYSKTFEQRKFKRKETLGQYIHRRMESADEVNTIFHLIKVPSADELDLLKGYSSDGEVRDLELINEKTISKLYDKNFFTGYCYRYWLDIKEKEFNGEYVYDLHPTKRAAKEWASLLLNHIEDER